MKTFWEKTGRNNGWHGTVIGPLVDLSGADLSGEDLSGVDLRGADLRWTKLNKASLKGTNLRWANLLGAELEGTELSDAILDFSCWPLYCGSFEAKADDRFVFQMVGQITRLNLDNCSEEAKAAVRALGPWANEFCRYRGDVLKIEVEAGQAGDGIQEVAA